MTFLLGVEPSVQPENNGIQCSNSLITAQTTTVRHGGDTQAYDTRQEGQSQQGSNISFLASNHEKKNKTYVVTWLEII